MDLSSSIDKAIEECVSQGILADYLERKGSEVKNMLIAEYDYNMDIEVQREEAHMIGKEEGKAEGRQLVNQLMQLLIQDNRLDDLQKSATDPEYQEELLQEYHLI